MFAKLDTNAEVMTRTAFYIQESAVEGIFI